MPASVDGASPRRVRRAQVAEEHAPNDHGALADELTIRANKVCLAGVSRQAFPLWQRARTTG
ncbi:hypothetical protein GCM10009712_03290 [Pseudarthrobacter sulfonivorans]|uniref:hypothetical protein n=1 Tax=Pseudarthrobacter sulfonivorans TaxID=121292 RepID=UPI00168B2ABB|nr:hypothetical protein [Pseudarthrobacter sulfonivorans]